MTNPMQYLIHYGHTLCFRTQNVKQLVHRHRTVSFTKLTTHTQGKRANTCPIGFAMLLLSRHASTYLSIRLFNAVGVVTSTPRVSLAHLNFVSSSLMMSVLVQLRRVVATTRPNEKVYTRLRITDENACHSLVRDWRRSWFGTTCGNQQQAAAPLSQQAAATASMEQTGNKPAW